MRSGPPQASLRKDEGQETQNKYGIGARSIATAGITAGSLGAYDGSIYELGSTELYGELRQIKEEVTICDTHTLRTKLQTGDRVVLRDARFHATLYGEGRIVGEFHRKNAAIGVIPAPQS